MANFAKEQLMKYGWTEGKGLGKNENGITEPVKLATNLDKAGIGYDDNDPWWETVFNDATKNVKVESHGDEVSLSVVNNTDRYTRVESAFWQTRQKFVKPLGIICKKAPISNQKRDVVRCDKTMVHDKAIEHGLALGGKLERVAQQDRIFLSKSLSNTALSRENDMAYRKTNVESDVEENEHEVDGNESTSRPEAEELIRSRSTRKKHRKRLNKLADQLSVCNLEESEETKERHDFLKFCQKIKKNKEMKIDSKVLFKERRTLFKERRALFKEDLKNKSDQISMLSIWHNPIPRSYHVKQLSKLGNSEERTLNQFNTVTPIYGACASDLKDKIEGHKIELDLIRNRLELTHSIELNKAIDGRCKYRDWAIVDVEAERQQKGDDYDLMVPIHDFHSRNKDFYNRKHKLIKSPKMQRRQRSKHMQKILEKLKDNVLSHEMNSVIKEMTTFGITEEVNANTIRDHQLASHPFRKSKIT